MKIVYVASEAAPFVKTGGLGDVAGAFPKALSEKAGNEVIVFLPYYKSVKQNPNIETEFIKSFYVDLSWRRQHVGVFKLKSRSRKLKTYFIDNEYYFGRDGIYGYGDDGERYAYFSKAVLQSLCELSVTPDIIHTNDWQTALIPTMLHAFYGDVLKNVKTVFTIHNIEYQGKADPYFLGDVLGLDASFESTLTFDKCINFMKGAILKSDAVTTVSKTYAEEIRYPYFAHGLSPIISEHSFKVSGIVNGIDTGVYDPKTDPSLFKNYSADDFSAGKAENKRELQKLLGLNVREDVPLIGMVTRLVSHKGLDLICGIINELMDWDIQIAILGTGDRKFENRLRQISEAHRDKFALCLRFDSSLASRIYSASDMYLMPSKSEPCGLSQLIAMRYGSIPIVNETGGLKDTVPAFNAQNGEGVGFTFRSFNCEDLKDALRRALTVFAGDKEAWSRAVTNAMKTNSSWQSSASEYLKLYGDILI